jgi:hypothetical protein
MLASEITGAYGHEQLFYCRAWATGLVASHTESQHQNYFDLIGPIFGPVAISFVVTLSSLWLLNKKFSLATCLKVLFSQSPISGRPISGKCRYPDRFVFGYQILVAIFVPGYAVRMLNIYSITGQDIK